MKGQLEAQVKALDQLMGNTRCGSLGPSVILSWFLFAFSVSVVVILDGHGTTHKGHMMGQLEAQVRCWTN